MDDQSYYSDTRHWDTGNDHLLWWALLLTLPIVILGFRFLMRGGPIFFVVISLVLIFIIYQIFDMFTPPAIHKTFYVPKYDATQIVKNVLADKNYPHEAGNGRFYLNEGIKITLKTKLERNLRVDGCIVQITPFTEENEPLILSLCTKIDDAFAPKGL